MHEPSRVDIENKYGSVLEIPCNSCQDRSTYHVNDIFARENKILLTIGATIAFGSIGILILMSLSSIFMLFFILSAIPIFIQIARGEALKKRVSAFNKNFVPRERNYQPKNKKTFN
ncbi:hypothetical protein N9B82_02960 [Saprospiraceae bacterium]|nr:hypothetical protein [Saprospiraceae bacterium]